MVGTIQKSGHGGGASRTRASRGLARIEASRGGEDAGAFSGDREAGPQFAALPDLSPIFLLSSFRTSSTWLWHKFRAAPGALAYYEIFNEYLDILSATSVADMHYRTWNSGHPPSAPYFIEFLPLLREGGGIRGYSAQMAFETLIPQGGLSGDLSAAEHDYVELLISSARAMGKVPVLSCTRALGRARGLKQAFGGRMVFCLRNLFHQWGSYCGQFAEGNPYFLQTVDWTLKAARHDPFLALVDDFTHARTASPADPRLFQAFLLLHLYLYAHAFEASDLTVDVSALARDADLRHETEAVLSRMLGTAVDLSDAKPSFDCSPLPISGLGVVRDGLEQFAKLIRASCRTRAGADFVEALAQAALGEWERHEFYAGRARVHHAAELDALRGRAEAGERAGAALAAERLAQAERDAAEAQARAAEQAQAAEALRAAAAATAALEAELAAMAAERESAAAQLAELERTRAEAQAAAERAVAEGQAQEQIIAQLHGEKNAFARQVEELAQAQGDLQAAIAGVSAMRDDLAAQLAAAEAAAARMQAELTALSAERQAHIEREAAEAQARAAEQAQAAEALRAAAAATAVLEAQLAAMAAERESAAAQLAELERLRSEAQAVEEAATEALRAAEAIQAELAGELAALKAERAVLNAQLAAALARPKGLVGATLSRLRSGKG